MPLPERDLKIHEAGIKLIRNLYPQLGASSDPRVSHIDAIVGAIRQKTEMYPFDNVFIEQYSSLEDKKAGGPFEAWSDDCSRYCSYFPLPGRIMWTVLSNNSVKKIKLLLEYWEQHRKLIRNDGYTTEGYAIPVMDFFVRMNAGGDNYCQIQGTRPMTREDFNNYC